MTIDTSKHFHILTLKEIASWQISTIGNNSEIEARIPSLQRGAVWEPQQIEMLWDSILRGFPIGSIVISKKIETQKDKKPITSAKQINEETTHHILDGQQRCNAIAWGFVDPWDESFSDDIVLWLDVKPEKRLKGSSRKYLFRVTTKAHPWGFKHDDNSSYLSTGEIHKAMDEIEKFHEAIKKESYFYKLITENDFIKKPTPRLAFPYDAGFPIPVSLLIKCKNEKLNFDEFIKKPIIKVIKEVVKSGNSDNKEAAESGISNDEFEGIMSAFSMIEKTHLVALQVPSGIEKEIDDIEQIFQRLNRQGTALDNEELAYSIIKAYWADVENIISSLPDHLRHSTEARLVSLGVRVALTEENATKISVEQDSKQIRNIFKDNDHTKQEKIEEFFKSDLQKSLEWIDYNLLYNKENHNYGLPKYLRSSIAWRSREVFAWLMLLAKEFNFHPINHKKAKKIIGLALTIHWFGVDKADAVNFLLSNKEKEIENFDISTLKDENGKKTFIHAPILPNDINKALQLNNASFKNWQNFWQGMVAHNEEGSKNSEDEAEKRKNSYLFVDKVRNEKELLIYAQRAYIESKFSDFDPSNKLMWKGFNRPWDYDHILPSNNIGGTGNKSLDYTKICQAWQGSIGNLTAVDFSFNREAQHKVSAEDKYKDKKDDGFNIFTNKLKCFNITHEETNCFEKSQEFVCAAKERLIKIYEIWYDTLEIGQPSINLKSAVKTDA